MRLLLIHGEAKYFAGAEKMLGYFLQASSGRGLDITVALVKGCRTETTVPAEMQKLYLADNQKFTVRGLVRQIGAICQWHRRQRFDLFHGWAARGWELTALAGACCSRPTLGTLHDHPQAGFISRPRRLLMRWSGRYGLKKVVCVSDAVRQACQEAGYPSPKLAVVHNGLPDHWPVAPGRSSGPFRLGFLSAFSERKGLRGLFATLDLLAQRSPCPWELFIAGGAQDEAGERLVTELQQQYAGAPWWSSVHWLGWVAQPWDFLGSIDLLVCPSVEFDPFPTVLLEAGLVGVPVLASRVGGVPEIVVDGTTGWLFESGQWREAAGILAGLLRHPGRAAVAGEQARQRISTQFTAGNMVAQYVQLYSTLTRDD